MGLGSIKKYKKKTTKELNEFKNETKEDIVEFKENIMDATNDLKNDLLSIANDLKDDFEEFRDDTINDMKDTVIEMKDNIIAFVIDDKLSKKEQEKKIEDSKIFTHEFNKKLIQKKENKRKKRDRKRKERKFITKSIKHTNGTLYNGILSYEAISNIHVLSFFYSDSEGNIESNKRQAFITNELYYCGVFTDTETKKNKLYLSFYRSEDSFTKLKIDIDTAILEKEKTIYDNDINYISEIYGKEF